jgi:hypothetical protein
MSAIFEEESTTVPVKDGQSVAIEAGQPWPSAYRGSKYSLVSDDDFEETVLKWEHRDLSIFTEPPSGLRRALVLLGKSGGRGSFRVTAGNEVLTKIPAEDYKHVDSAPVDSGWIPVYVGKLEDPIDFDEVRTNPTPPSQSDIKVWDSFPFNHGERWAVSHDDKLIWKWRDYRFESAFDHPELIGAYQKYRGIAGRIYVTENAQVWVNLPKQDIQPGQEETVAKAIREWKEQAEDADDVTSLRLVNRRLVATSQEDDPSTGHFPVHIGHLSDFDGGKIPRPVVDDEGYYQAVCEYEEVWE